METEKRNAKTEQLDTFSIYEILKVMNEEDALVPLAIRSELREIEKVIQNTICTMKKGGRVFYIGSGTSGRLGVLDAAEVVPTFNVSSEHFQGIIAGGKDALLKAKEGVEDSKEEGVKDLQAVQLTKDDMVIGIAASGSTPYVIGALEYANTLDAKTASLSCNKDSVISRYADISMEIDTGAEVLTGSTRLKAGTAQKLVLNMISTATMVKLGKVYSNLMVDLQPTNQKLYNRAVRIIAEATGAPLEKAEEMFLSSHKNPKLAIVRILTNSEINEAEKILEHNHYYVRESVK